jgi:hypothetical protein
VSGVPAARAGGSSRDAPALSAAALTAGASRDEGSGSVRGTGSRVSLVCDSENWGGAEVYLTHLLRRAGDQGRTASLVCAEPLAARFAPLLPPDRLAVVPLARHSGTAPAVRAALAAQRPDAVLVNLVDPGSNAAAVAAALAVAPTVGVLHLPGDPGTGEERAHLAGLYGAMAAVLTPAAGARDQLVTELRVPAHRVVVGGEGRDGDRLRAAAAGLPVTFRGFVDGVRGFLAGLDVFCLSSRREALPLVLLEAMAEGLPCVATDVGDVAVAVGADAVVVPPEDAGTLAAALAGLLADPAARAELGRRARARAVAAFDADLMARRTFAVLPTPGGPASRPPGRAGA